MPAKLHFNGIDGATGNYLTAPQSEHEFSRRLVAGFRGQRPGRDEVEHRAEIRKTQEPNGPPLGVKAGVDATRLSEAGWGIIFAADDEDAPAIQEALQPLLALRRGQAGERFRLFQGHDGYRPGETKNRFLRRYNMSPGPADPDRVPYYLLIAGDPERIPFSFQYQLDVQYAVGRLHFDSLDAYASYAAGVAAAEAGQLARRTTPRRATFFGVTSPDDPATEASAEYLVRPLAERLGQAQAHRGATWQVQTILGREASKARLAGLLQGDQAPALLFTASHGMAFPAGDPRQQHHQGGLLCADWPGPVQWQGPIPPEFYFSADDLGADTRVQGLVAVHFACYGAGAPRYADQAFAALHESTELAPRAFVARLPQQVLGHPRGAALAVIGHVERAWGYSFLWEGVEGPQLATFESVLTGLMQGQPVGLAAEYLNERYAELAEELGQQIPHLLAGRQYDEAELAGLWTALNDARGYVIIGDPAVRLVSADT